MANSLSLIPGGPSSLTQPSSTSAAAVAAAGGGIPVVVDPASASAPPGGPGAVQQKRKRGRPKGSTTKKQPDDGTNTTTTAGGGGGASASAGAASAEPKLKRPVGRPRKDGLPAGSVPKRSSVKKQKLSDPDGAADPGGGGGGAHFLSGFPPPWTTGVGYPPHPHHHHHHQQHPHPVPPISYIPQDTKFVLDEWGELVQTDPHSFLAALLSAVAAPNPTSATGPNVEEAFKIHLQSLAPNSATAATAPTAHNIPSLYSILKTFWLPSSPSYFTVAASASNTRVPMQYRFLYWDPQPLVFNGIQCPFCPNFLINNGRIHSGPIKVYDLDKPFFIIGCEYICTSPQCTASTTQQGRKFSSTDASIMNSLPKGLKDEFPAHLLYADTDAGSGPNIWNWTAMGVSTALWNLVMGGLSIGLRKEAILQLVKSIQYGPPEIKYEMKEEETTSAMPAGMPDDADGDSTADTTAQPVVQNGWNVDEAQSHGDTGDARTHGGPHPTHASPSFHPAGIQQQQQQPAQAPPQPQPQPTVAAPAPSSSLITPVETIAASAQHVQHPDMYARTRGQPQPQPQYTYSQYPYYPDQSASVTGPPPNTGRQSATANSNQLTR